jgi:pyruvate/2-oxoglutarate dehydrogenase complex dihydrolipoamide dehydrogenase (E3) component
MTPEFLNRECDVVVIGAGAAGETVARRVAQGGLRAVLVEAQLAGGESAYWACLPSKALLRSGTALHAAQTVPGAEEAVTRTLNAEAVLRRRNHLTSNWQDHTHATWLSEAGIELIRGQGRLTGPRRVEAAGLDGNSYRFTARHAVVLATGSIPNIPSIDGLAGLKVWGTREATSTQEIPQRLAVLGGGMSGTELSQAFARLGSRVTLVARSALLGNFPEEAANLVTAGLRADGVEIHLGTTAKNVSDNGDGSYTLALSDGASITADRVLLAMGRRPAVEGLGLETLGHDAAEGRMSLITDASGLVQGTKEPDPWLYAVGDAAGTAMYTHQGKYAARVTSNAILARANGAAPGAETWGQAPRLDLHAAPRVLFTDPEVATVGRSVEQAAADGHNASSVELPIQVAGSSLHSEHYDGWAQLVVDEDRNVLLGATFAGQDVAELLHAATIAVVGEVPLDRLWHAVPAYPTVSEVWLQLLEKYGL